MQRFLAVGFGLTALTLFSGNGTLSTSTLTPVMPVGCQGVCLVCTPSTYHALENRPHPEKVFDVEVACSQQLPGSCDFYPDCGGFATRDALERLWYSVARNDETSIKQLMTEHPDRVVIVPERTAIQVLDCSGEEVVGQVNLSTRLSKRVTKWSATRAAI